LTPAWEPYEGDGNGTKGSLDYPGKIIFPMPEEGDNILNSEIML